MPCPRTQHLSNVPRLRGEKHDISPKILHQAGLETARQAATSAERHALTIASYVPRLLDVSNLTVCLDKKATKRYQYTLRRIYCYYWFIWCKQIDTIYYWSIWDPQTTCTARLQLRFLHLTVLIIDGVIGARGRTGLFLSVITLEGLVIAACLFLPIIYRDTLRQWDSTV